MKGMLTGGLAAPAVAGLVGILVALTRGLRPGRHADRMARKRLAVAVGMAAFLAAAGGCQDSDEPSASAAFLEDADAVCTRALDRHPRVESVDTQEDAVRATGSAVSRHTYEERGLKRLTAPGELQRDFTTFERDTHQMQQLAVSGRAAALDGIQALYNRALKDYTATGNHRGAVGKRIGFKNCGNRSQT